jgi:hypothetical protein
MVNTSFLIDGKKVEQIVVQKCAKCFVVMIYFNQGEVAIYNCGLESLTLLTDMMPFQTDKEL